MSDIPGGGYHIFPHLNVKEKADIKRKRGQMSCAECRRLKLKCDKKIPCSSCVRRGCQSLCPTEISALALARRATPSDMKELQKRTDSLTQRIRQLEDALAVLQSTVSSEIHPLLREDQHHQQTSIFSADQTSIDNTPEPNVNNVAEAFGTLSLGEYGNSRYFGRSAGTESLLAQGSESAASSPSSTDDTQTSTTLPSEISQLVNSFPLASDGAWDVTQSMNILLSYLPEKQRAWTLAEIYLNYDPWSPSFVLREELFGEILEPLYRYLSTAVDTEDITGDLPITPQRLALLFFCFAHASLADYSLSRYHIDSEYYFDLGRASLCLHPILTSPDLTSVQAMGLASLFLHYGGPRYNIEGAWAYITMAVKLAHAVGLRQLCTLFIVLLPFLINLCTCLDHESPTWGLDEKTLRKRRLVFWELFVNDSFISLALGRPPSIHLLHGEPLVPDDADDSVDEEGKKEPGYIRWRMEFCRDVLSRVVDVALSPNVPDYKTILEIDARVHQHPMPKKYHDSLRKLFSMPGESLPIPIVLRQNSETGPELITLPMRGYQIFLRREIVNIHIHRVFFARALLQSPADPSSGTYATSYLAAYRSASAAISVTASYVQKDLEQIIRCWAIIPGLFSAGIVVGLIVTHCPTCAEAENAFKELAVITKTFEICAAHSPRAKSGLEVLLRLHYKASKAFHSSSSQEDRQQSDVSQEDVSDVSDALHELEMFVGQTKLLTTKSTPNIKPIRTSPEGDGAAASKMLTGSTPHYGIIPQLPSTEMDYDYDQLFSRQSDTEVQMSSYSMDPTAWSQQGITFNDGYDFSVFSTPPFPTSSHHPTYSQPESRSSSSQDMPTIDFSFSSTSSSHKAWPPADHGYNY
ncbi:hypothetical protein GYMLUDRAFT_204658 [Collybiopsis luxurians FD-317 M1]|uniref:Zn(2)-C6 fungal-type domain-containing protein n=1 Tax=Collybiopsis luxurians FD-317 M1 TaxID=944289 RepID=A0A0D0C2Z7_9AGAR|nr:hypothetical protein GYMLUDRAFT_204658 [Collybiopsis luxurians FD-317 M1]